MEDLGGRSGGSGVPKGISGGAEEIQGKPKGGPRGVQGGPGGDFGGVRKRSEKRRRLLVVGWDLLGPFWVPFESLWVPFGKCGGYAGPGGGVRGG